MCHIYNRYLIFFSYICAENCMSSRSNFRGIRFLFGRMIVTENDTEGTVASSF